MDLLERISRGTTTNKDVSLTKYYGGLLLIWGIIIGVVATVGLAITFISSLAQGL